MNASHEHEMEAAWRRSNRQVLFDYLTNGVLPILSEEGTWMAPDPAPLTAEEVKPIFEQVAQHETYTRQHMITRTNDGKCVELQNGVTRVEEDL